MNESPCRNDGECGNLVIDGEPHIIACHFPKKGIIRKHKPFTVEQLRDFRLVGEASVKQIKKMFAEKGIGFYEGSED